MKRRTGDPAATGGMNRFAQHRAIRRARGLTKGEKTMLYTLWDYANEAGDCWASLKSLALDAEFSEGGAGKVLARLAAMGIVETKPPTGRAGAGGRGKTATRRINYAKLLALAEPTDNNENTRSARGFHNHTIASKTPALHEKPPRPARENPRPARTKQTITNHEQTRGTNHREEGSEPAARDDGWMPGAHQPGASTERGETVRHALAACGVRGPNLDRLAAAPGLTAAMVRDEYRSIKGDPHARNKPAVLVTRLFQRIGVVSKRSGAVSADVREMVAQLEQQRRNLGSVAP